MTTINFHTLTWKDKKYRVESPFGVDRTKKVLAEFLGVPVEEVFLQRGALSTLPDWTDITLKDMNEKLQDMWQGPEG